MPRPPRAVLVAAAVAAAAAVVALLVPGDDGAVAVACPALDREVWTGEVRRGPSDRLATPGAREIVVCTYDGFDRRPRAAVRLASTTDEPWEPAPAGRRIAGAIAAVTSGPSMPRGGPIRPPCPPDDGGRYLVLLRYDSHAEAVTVRRSGCGTAYNGTWQTPRNRPPLTGLLDEAVA